MSVLVTDELTEAICELRVIFPDWRMGQLVANLAMAAGADGAGIWEVADEQLLAVAHSLIDGNRGRRANCGASGNAPDSGQENTSPGSLAPELPRQLS